VRGGPRPSCRLQVHRLPAVEELDSDRAAYYQTRFWARVEVEPFIPEHEMTARRLVETREFLSTLFWGGEATARLILERGLVIEDELASKP
jgi:hypothetical protein